MCWGALGAALGAHNRGEQRGMAEVTASPLAHSILCVNARFGCRCWTPVAGLEARSAIARRVTVAALRAQYSMTSCSTSCRQPCFSCAWGTGVRISFGVSYCSCASGMCSASREPNPGVGRGALGPDASGTSPAR